MLCLSLWHGSSVFHYGQLLLCDEELLTMFGVLLRMKYFINLIRMHYM